MSPDRKTLPRWLVISLRLFFGVAALTFTLYNVKLADLKDAAFKLGFAPLAMALFLCILGLILGAIRWRVLLSAFGATNIPPMRSLARMSFIGMFFNTFLPGNVGGDAMRGFLTRDCFKSVTGAFLIIFLDRLFGLAGLFALAGTSSLLFPIEALKDAWIWRLMGPVAVLAALATALLPLMAHRVSKFVPGRVGQFLHDQPTVRSPGLLAVALFLSFATQTQVALTFHVFVSALAPDILFTQTLTLAPIAAATAYAPISVAGLGVRDAAFQHLFALVGVLPAASTAASLGFFCAQLLTALIGAGFHFTGSAKQRVTSAETEAVP